MRRWRLRLVASRGIKIRAHCERGCNRHDGDCQALHKPVSSRLLTTSKRHQFVPTNNSTLKPRYFRLAYCALARNKKGRSGSESFHSTEKPGRRCAFVAYGMVRQKASQRGEQVASWLELGLISSATLCREEFAARGLETDVGPPTVRALSTDGRCLSIAGGPPASPAAVPIRWSSAPRRPHRTT